jgi:hypothetical protein
MMSAETPVDVQPVQPVKQEPVEGEQLQGPGNPLVTPVVEAVLGERQLQPEASRLRGVVDYESSDAESVSSEMRRKESRKLANRECLLWACVGIVGEHEVRRYLRQKLIRGKTCCLRRS